MAVIGDVAHPLCRSSAGIQWSMEKGKRALKDGMAAPPPAAVCSGPIGHLCPDGPWVVRWPRTSAHSITGSVRQPPVATVEFRAWPAHSLVARFWIEH